MALDRSNRARPVRRSLRAVLSRLATFEGFGVKATLADAAAEAAQVTGSPKPTPGKHRVLPSSEFEGLRFAPESYTDARAFATVFRSGQRVLLDLGGLPDEDAKRLVDFAAGLAFHSGGTIERVTNKLFLLTPPDLADPPRSRPTPVTR